MTIRATPLIALAIVLAALVVVFLGVKDRDVVEVGTIVSALGALILAALPAVARFERTPETRRRG